MAEAKTAKTAPVAETVKVEKHHVPDMEKKVTIRLDKDRYYLETNEDEVVWVNSRRFLIKRGVNVEVPESVADVITNRDRQLENYYDYEKKMSKR